MDHHQEAAPIIIYGAPRSGTTYLNRILNEHPDIFITHETRLFVWAHRSLNVLTRSDLVLLSYRERFVEHLYAQYARLIRDFYRGLRPTVRYWGDKSPHYASPENQGCLDTIAALFPGTRFIHIMRDGRDVVTSLLRKGWVDFDVAHQLWMHSIDIGCEFGRQQPDTQYCEIRYEELIREDVSIAEQLFDFLGIEMHRNVLEFCRAQQRERTPFSDPTRDLHQDVTRSNWNRLLSRDQQLRSLERLASHLVRYGYETESSLGEYLSRLSSERVYEGAPVR